MRASMGEAFSEFGHADTVKFGELVIVWDLTIKKGVGLPCTNWLKVGVALLMSSRPGETSQHRGMKCGVVSWVS